MDPIATGRLIRRKRIKHQLTQQQLAEKLYVEKATVSSWETGKSFPNMESQMLIFKELKINPLELMCGKTMRNKDLKKGVEDFIMNNTDKIVFSTEQGEQIELPVDGWFIAAADKTHDHLTGDFECFDWDDPE